MVHMRGHHRQGDGAGAAGHHRLPVRENPYSWNPLDSTNDKTLFILLVPQTASPYPMYYVAYQTEQWGTFFLDEGSTSWGRAPRVQ